VHRQYQRFTDQREQSQILLATAAVRTISRCAVTLGSEEIGMPSVNKYPSDVAFTPSVKAVQSRKGSRHAYERVEARGSWQTSITAELKAFIEAQRSVFLATTNRDGQPTIQHRGGPAGFLRVLDEKTIAFVDFVGNRQYITVGNLAENPKAHLFLIDYAHQRRIKIWGEARVVEGDDGLIAKLMPEGYKARPEQVILFTVGAWDANCPQHIPQRFEAADVAASLAQRDNRILELESEIERLRAQAQPRERNSA
jgi:predicted pyridoxine 5'-phosphate oxidase superfamily flavin-nucleotide-binding protein